MRWPVHSLPLAMAARDHSHSPSLSHSRSHLHQTKKVPLFPFLSLLCFISIFLLLSLIRKISVPSQSRQSFQFRRSDESDPGASHGSCDYSDGTWVYDPSARSARYDNTCKEIFKGWNCISGNKSNARDLINWRWKPRQCDLPSFDPEAFLRKYRDTSIGTLSFSLSLKNDLEGLNVEFS